jgi:hypothetical protein
MSPFSLLVTTIVLNDAGRIDTKVLEFETREQADFAHKAINSNQHSMSLFNQAAVKLYAPLADEDLITLPQTDPPRTISVLDAIAAGRDYINTPEFARAIGMTSQTVRKNHHLFGSCYGIKPRKIGNRLCWPVAKVAQLIRRGERKP